MNPDDSLYRGLSDESIAGRLGGQGFQTAPEEPEVAHQGSDADAEGLYGEGARVRGGATEKGKRGRGKGAAKPRHTLAEVSGRVDAFSSDLLGRVSQMQSELDALRAQQQTVPVRGHPVFGTAP